ncbi:hypothetical protein A3B51_00530 [Candidatus Curtissbacteria bacterium RIFCSPLOWO2_01_FULL_41_18]|uniref:Sortase n=2 Tax=Candidatus Curtissiibacteriota TaxID=1752717 RepID=A0A1F5G0D5_9BACT|nr:MAG: hypothetical protein A2696_02495 [Candidatus Curtissbacteria bacterium RIFCSPHIGHO2_01_FULL_41_13]OGE04952.1 MAG: hypothetical protein A3B51_00530 [Candidatus Curtissbacteria bacterium RIFCSPLOWO2_01_FULL_41_18]
MTLAIYIKDPPKLANKKTRKKDRYFYLLISLVGLLSIIFAVWPYFLWQLTTARRLTAKVQDFPIPQKEVLSASQISQANVQVVKDPDGFSYFTTTYKPQGNRPKEFYVTIPKLKIENATAKVDNLNFKNNLSHFPGSALPGEIGNAFITGHSVLPQFNDPNDYNAIFTKLDSLEVGDEVYAQIGDQRFKYVVQYSKVVDPQDTSVLQPLSSQGKNLTLMTCVPPGTSTKRLVVITSLI